MAKRNTYNEIAGYGQKAGYWDAEGDTESRDLYIAKANGQIARVASDAVKAQLRIEFDHHYNLGAQASRALAAKCADAAEWVDGYESVDRYMYGN